MMRAYVVGGRPSLGKGAGRRYTIDVVSYVWQSRRITDWGAVGTVGQQPVEIEEGRIDVVRAVEEMPEEGGVRHPRHP